MGPSIRFGAPFCLSQTPSLTVPQAHPRNTYPTYIVRRMCSVSAATTFRITSRPPPAAPRAGCAQTHGRPWIVVRQGGRRWMLIASMPLPAPLPPRARADVPWGRSSAPRSVLPWAHPRWRTWRPRRRARPARSASGASARSASRTGRRVRVGSVSPAAAAPPNRPRSPVPAPAKPPASTGAGKR
jgi:hypothetical protein